MSDAVVESLSLCEEDLSQPVYDRFFAASASGRELMGHADEYMRGRMLQQVFELFMLDGAEADDYLAWEVDNHIASYGVHADMYRDFFDALQVSVKESLGDAWTTDFDAAWSARIEDLLEKIAVAEANLAR